MQVRDLMQSDVLVVDEAMSLSRLLDLMTAAHVHAAPVVGPDGELIGIVSQEDILVGGLGLGNPAQAEQLTVGEIMTSPAMSVTADTSLRSVARLMWRFRIHHVPVIDESGHVVGVVSSLDFARYLAAAGPDDDGDD